MCRLVGAGLRTQVCCRALKHPRAAQFFFSLAISNTPLFKVMLLLFSLRWRRLGLSPNLGPFFVASPVSSSTGLAGEGGGVLRTSFNWRRWLSQNFKHLHAVPWREGPFRYLHLRGALHQTYSSLFLPSLGEWRWVDFSYRAKLYLLQVQAGSPVA